MTDRLLVALPADLVQKIDANRGEMGRAEFLTALLDSALKDGRAKSETPHYVTHQELDTFKQDIRSLLRGFLDFFIVYGLELGGAPKGEDLHALRERLMGAVEDGPHVPGPKAPRA